MTKENTQIRSCFGILLHKLTTGWLCQTSWRSHPQTTGKPVAMESHHRSWGISEAYSKRTPGNNRYLQQQKFVLDAKNQVFKVLTLSKVKQWSRLPRERAEPSILRNFQNLAEQGPSLPLKLSLLWAWGRTRWLSKVCSNLSFRRFFSWEASRG